MLSEPEEAVIEPVNNLLEQSRQIWLLGAGISKQAGIPLMWKLTVLVRKQLQKVDEDEDTDYSERYESIYSHLDSDANVEDILDYIGNIIEITNRTSSNRIEVGQTTWRKDYLYNFHNQVLESIKYIIKNGSDPSQQSIDEFEVWDPQKSKINIDQHRRFVRELFRNRPEAGEPLLFFTTNYDTLLEDAISLERKSLYDGFTGGSVAFWNPRREDSKLSRTKPLNSFDAHIYKLHGSIDWVEDGDAVLRTRDSSDYHNGRERLLIYPQATKYELMQRAPFGNLFEKFRRELFSDQGGLLAVCGYSFADNHINDDIERALNSEKSNLTLLAFIRENEPDDDSDTDFYDRGKQLPRVIRNWISSENGEADFSDQVVVATDKGLYKGSTDNPFEREFSVDRASESIDWWKFSGLIEFIKHETPNIE